MWQNLMEPLSNPITHHAARRVHIHILGVARMGWRGCLEAGGGMSSLFFLGMSSSRWKKIRMTAAGAPNLSVPALACMWRLRGCKHCQAPSDYDPLTNHTHRLTPTRLV